MTQPADPLDHVAVDLEGFATGIANEFVRIRAGGSTAASEDTGHRGGDQFDRAFRIVHLCASRLRGGDDLEDEWAEFEAAGAQVALAGRPVTEAVEWLRALERVVQDHLLSHTDLHEADAREAFASIGRSFDELCTQQLQAYANTHDELAEGFSHVVTDLIGSLVSGAPIQPHIVNGHARVLNIEPHQPFRAVAIQHDGNPHPQQWAQIKRRITALLGRYDRNRDFLVRDRGGLLLAVVPARGEHDLVETLRGLLEDDELRQCLYVATGEQAGSLAEAGRTCRQALSALELAIYRGQLGHVTQCTEVILEVLLVHNHWVSRRIIDSRLQGLVDKPHLLETLRAYIDCDMALHRTAEELVVHPNTVAYRLRQIAKLTRRDMRRVADLSDLMVALMALDVVEMRRDQEDGRIDLRAKLLADYDAKASRPERLLSN